VFCPSCNSSDLRKASLIHAAGVYESQGQVRGLFFGDLFFGRYKGTNQSRLSKLVGPPAKFPSAALNNTLGGLNSIYQTGGPRSLQRPIGGNSRWLCLALGIRFPHSLLTPGPLLRGKYGY
jgi:hypothetical protein